MTNEIKTRRDIVAEFLDNKCNTSARGTMKLKDIIKRNLGSPYLEYIETHASEHTRKELEKEYKEEIIKKLFLLLSPFVILNS